MFVRNHMITIHDYYLCNHVAIIYGSYRSSCDMIHDCLVKIYLPIITKNLFYHPYNKFTNIIISRDFCFCIIHDSYVSQCDR